MTESISNEPASVAISRNSSREIIRTEIRIVFPKERAFRDSIGTQNPSGMNERAPRKNVRGAPLFIVFSARAFM